MDIVKGAFALLSAYMIVQLALFTLAVTSCMYWAWQNEVHEVCSRDRFATWVREWDRALEILLSLIAGRALSK